MSQQSDSENDVQISLDYRLLKYFAGIFFLAGVGLGLTGLLSVGYFGGVGGVGGTISTGFFMLVTLIIAFSIGPVLGVIVANGLPARFTLGENAYLSTFVGGAVGYLVMVLTVALILAIGIALLVGGGGQDGTGGPPDGATNPNPLTTLLNLLGPMIVFSIPTGLVCAGTVYANERDVLGSHAPTSPPRTASEPPRSADQPSTEPAAPDTSERGEEYTAEISDHFRVTRGFGLGILAALLVSALVVGIISIEPFGEAAVPLVPPYTPLNVIRLYSWFILMAHGVAVSGFTLEITRLSLLQAAPIVGMGVAGWVGGKLWVEELSRLVTPETMRDVAARALDDAFDRGFRTTSSGQVAFNPEPVRQALGLNRKASARADAIGTLLKKTGGLDRQALEAVLDGMARLAQTEIPNMSTFIARRGTIGGMGSIVRGILPGVALTSAGAAGGGVAGGVFGGLMGMLLSVGGGRAVSSMLANPTAARSLKAVMRKQASRSNKTANAVRLLRFGVDTMVENGDLAQEAADSVFQSGRQALIDLARTLNPRGEATP